jgi:hypothetical protein
MYDVIIKRGDTRNCIKAVLKDASGTPVDLTDCSVSFHMAPLGLNRKARVSRAVHIQNAAAGEVWVVWAPGETDAAGFYQAEFEVMYQDGKRETFPNANYISIRILEDLG